jgi:hypothetical protein
MLEVSQHHLNGWRPVWSRLAAMRRFVSTSTGLVTPFPLSGPISRKEDILPGNSKLLLKFFAWESMELTIPAEFDLFTAFRFQGGPSGGDESDEDWKG